MILRCGANGCLQVARHESLFCEMHQQQADKSWSVVQGPTFPVLNPVSEQLDVAIKFDAIVEQMRATFRQKNKAYGNSFADFGDYGILIRVSDKLSRLKTLYKNPSIDKGDESIEDTWKDLAVYGVLALICRSQAEPTK